MAAGSPPPLGRVDDATADLLIGARVASAAVTGGAKHPDLLSAAVREFRRAAVLEAASASVAALLADQGISCVLLKGAALARRHWPEDAVRDMGDVDVLVTPADYPRARAALLAAGYVLCDRHHPGWYVRRWFYHESFMPAGLPIIVELHWDFMRPGLGVPCVPELLEEAIKIPTAVGDLPSPSDPWHLLVACAHALHEVLGLRQLLDVTFVARSLDDGGWVRAVEVAQRANLGVALYYGVTLAAERLAWVSPPAVADLRPGTLHDRLVRRYAEALPLFGAPGPGLLQLHHAATPFLHCAGARCLTRLPHAMLTDRANFATDLQRLADRLRGR